MLCISQIVDTVTVRGGANEPLGLHQLTAMSRPKRSRLALAESGGSVSVSRPGTRSGAEVTARPGMLDALGLRDGESWCCTHR